MSKMEFSESSIRYNKKRLTNQIFKILPMSEQGEDWHAQLDSVLRDLRGYNNICDDPAFMTLFAKLSLLETADHQLFRKLIFEAITELNTIKE